MCEQEPSQWPVRDGHPGASRKRPVSVRTKCRLEWVGRILLLRFAAAYGASFAPRLGSSYTGSLASPRPASVVICGSERGKDQHLVSSCTLQLLTVY